MIVLLALRSLRYRPRRSLLLLAGYGVGVGVMIVLLAIGEAMLLQARDEKLVGGGEVTVLPSGMDLEVMKTGGVGGLYLSIPNARFVHLQLLANERLARHVAVVSPQIEGKLLYLRTPRGEWPVRATGEIPSTSRALGVTPPVRAGRWEDDPDDRKWLAPTDAELRHLIDRFHLPAHGSRPREERESWAEWHYFNVLLDGGRRWAFVTLMVAGDVPDGRWGGQVLITLHELGAPARRYVARVPATEVVFTTGKADLSVGSSFVRVLEDGRYHVRAHAQAAEGSSAARIDLRVAPARGAYFPGTTLSDDAVTSGYAVAALRASASGTICAEAECLRAADAPAYHDHNWGYWSNVDWEWGAAHAGPFALLYGRVQQVGATEHQPLFLYLVDSLGFLAMFRPRDVEYVDARILGTPEGSIRVPSHAVLSDARSGDTVRLAVTVEDAAITDVRTANGARRARSRPWFVQMKGRVRLTGRIAGRRIDATGQGFFETYR